MSKREILLAVEIEHDSGFDENALTRSAMEEMISRIESEPIVAESFDLLGNQVEVVVVPYARQAE
jgi:hypothetical protein